MKFKSIFFAIMIVLCFVLLLTGCELKIGGGNSSSSTDSELLEFELNDDGKSYKVFGVNGKCPTDIIIPAEHKGLPVTVIGRSAFALKQNIESVVLPDTIVEIEACAFEANYALKEINIPNSVVVIRNSAFIFCSSLTEIVIPDSVKMIEGGAFKKCTALESVSLGNGITTIEADTFLGCVALREIILPQSLEEIEKRAFVSCENLYLSELPSSLAKIESFAFEGCDSILRLTLPESLKTIEEGAFNGCDYLFEICNKSNVEISTDYNYGAKHLKRVIEDEAQSYFTYNGEFVVYDDGNDIILMRYTGNGEDVVFPEYTDGREYTVCQGVIPMANQVKSITLSKSIGKIEKGAFKNCLDAETLIIECASSGIDSNIFDNFNHARHNKIKNIYINTQAALDNNIYNQFDYVENIVFGEGVTSIPKGFIHSHILKRVQLSSSIEIIGGGAFGDCSHLETVIIPENSKITEINDYAFYDCGFRSFVVPKGVTRIGKYAFAYSSLEEIILPENVAVIDERAFMQCKLLESIKMPDSLEIIGIEAFSGCDKLTKVEIGNNSSLHTIENSAFMYCTYLSEIFIPKTVANIEPFAFGGCKHIREFIVDPDNPYYFVYDRNIYSKDFTVLVYKAPGYGARVTIPASVKKIGEGAFYGTTVTSLEFEEGSNLEVIGAKAFHYCDIKTVTLPQSVKVIEEGAFSYCQTLQSISFENGSCLERIEQDAFRDCYQLNSISLPISLKFIGSGAFIWGTIDEIYYEGTLEEWNAIVKEEKWIRKSSEVKVHCTDQTIVIE